MADLDTHQSFTKLSSREFPYEHIHSIRELQWILMEVELCFFYYCCCYCYFVFIILIRKYWINEEEAEAEEEEHVCVCLQQNHMGWIRMKTELCTLMMCIAPTYIWIVSQQRTMSTFHVTLVTRVRLALAQTHDMKWFRIRLLNQE